MPSKCKSIKRLIPATCAWVLLLSTTAMFFIFPCRRLHEEYHYSVTITQAIITFFVISNLFATTFVDPGIIKRANEDEDPENVRSPIHIDVYINKEKKQKNNGEQQVKTTKTLVRMKWCSTCRFYRPPRCSHCSVCDNCIERFDHHCPWVNNCIGRRNYRHFFFFLIFLTLHMITIFIWCLLFAINNRKEIRQPDVLVATVLIIIIIILFVPIVGLTGFHIVLVARGRTTNEQVTKKFKNQENPFSKEIHLNCIYTLCGPRYPGLYRPKPSKHVHENKSTEKKPVIRDYLDQEQGEKYIDDQNFSIDDNPKDILLEYHQMKIIKSGKNNKSSDSSSYSESGQSEPLKKYSRNSDELTNLFDVKPRESHKVVTMHHTENGTKETTFIALPSNPMKSSHLNIDNKTTSPPPSSIFQHNNKISALKSTSINEISSHLKRSPLKNHQQHHYNHQKHQAGPEGGMLIYYSPDAGAIGYQQPTSPNVTSKYNSESELQKYRNTQPQYLQYIDDDPVTIATDILIGGPSGANNDRYNFKKPMPFQKALEISNQIDEQQKQQFSPNKNRGNNDKNNTSSSSPSSNKHRQSQYEMNYEISV